MVKLSRAKDEQGNTIFIGEVKHETNMKYCCEVCGGELIPKALNSEKKKPHFAHKPDCDCTDTWLNHNNKGDWHIKWQEKFPKEYREVAIGDENEKHRADVQVFSCVVEFQHSPISYEDFTKRNQFYTKHHNDVIWVFDGDILIDQEWVNIIDPPWRVDGRIHKFKRTQNQFMNFDDKNGKVTVIFQMNNQLFVGNEITQRTVRLSLKHKDVNCFVKQVAEQEYEKIQKIQKELKRIEQGELYAEQKTKNTHKSPKKPSVQPIIILSRVNKKPTKSRRF